MIFFLKNLKPYFSRPILALLLISGLFMFAFNLLSPIFAIFVEDVGGDITTASTASAIFLATAGLLTFVAGKYENVLKEKELGIMWAQFVLGIGYLLYYFTDSVAMVYVVQIVLGIGEALYWPAFHAVYAQHANGQNSITQWSIYDGLAYLIPAVGAELGGWLVKWYGFGVVFLIMATISFLAGLFILFLPRKVL
ncbi:MAG TPA: MFS transporter [bacterium]|nr:MFS transporter [bacterium]